MTFRQHIYKALEVDIYGNFDQFSKREKENRMSAEDIEFGKFKKDVDSLLVSMCGLTSDDLTDATWRDYFQSELSPVNAILCAADDAWYDEPDLQEVIWDQVERGKA